LLASRVIAQFLGSEPLTEGFASRADLSTRLVGFGVAPHRRCGRPLLARRNVPINEPLGVLSQIVVRVEGAFEHLARDVLGDVPGPTLGGVKGDHAKRARILPAQEIADHRLPIGLGNIGLDKARPSEPKSLTTKYTVTSSGYSDAGRGMVRSSQKPKLTSTRSVGSAAV
jgi:hypothetical protein